MHIAVRPVAKRTAFDNVGNPVEGAITDEVAALGSIPAGRILLLNGAQGATGGFGLAHLEDNTGRIKQINSLGFKSAHAYVRFILADPTHIAHAEGGRINVIREDGTNYHHLICQWDAELALWSVTTAIPKRHARKLKLIWKK